jgi:glucose-1-phosphatase
MIKNIVFDLGNVLISFKPSEYLDRKDYPENLKSKILSEIFSSKEWLLLDNGDITTSEAIESISSTSSLTKEEITGIFDLRTDLIFPIDQNVKLLPELKKQGYKLYFLSNFPLDVFEDIKSDYYFFRFFDGGIISAEAKSSKPDKRIYEILIEKYDIVPGESLYIDDLEANVKTAELLGMKGLITHGVIGVGKEVERALNL